MSEYLKIVFQNIEPLRIADDSSSQSGQTVTLRYIPGTALRGVVLNALTYEDDFEIIKKSLLSPKIRFLNAYVTDKEQELIPSLKGFYEDKTEQKGKKEIDNVVIRGEFEEGKKRAALGRFSRIDGDCIYCYNIDTGSDLKIKINDEKQNVFRHEYICAGYVFTGYIAVEDSTLRDRIKNVFASDFAVGNGRSAGLGKCKVINCTYTDELPYERYLPTDNLKNECYMMLLSNTVMRSASGELCGLNCSRLADKMNVDKLKIAFCATSTVDVKGYNRKWGTKIPTTVMYEQGSVFHLEYEGILTRKQMYTICDQGIGIRLNEGFGRVLFLKGYENIKYKEGVQLERKKKIDTIERQCKEDQDTLKVAARCYYRNLLERKMNTYVVVHPLSRGMVANSQLGILESFAIAYKYEPIVAKRSIDQYFEHALKKEESTNIQKSRYSVRELRRYVQEEIWDKDLETLLNVSTKQKESIMGIPKSDLLTEDEKLQMKLELLTKIIRYDNKKEEA